MKPSLYLSIPFALSCAPKQLPLETVQITVKQSSPTVPQQVANYLLHEGLAVDDCYGTMLDTSQGEATLCYTPGADPKTSADDLLLVVLYSANNHVLYMDYGVEGGLDYLVNEAGQPTSFDALDPTEQLRHATRYQQTLLDLVAYIQQHKNEPR